MRCLLVDDEPGIREGLAAWLRRQGLDVRTAADCAAARAALAEPFDVVVTDWRLPDGLAASFLGEVRVPVLAVSGHPEEVDASPALCAVLTKPMAPSRLLAAIRAAVPGVPAGADTDVPVRALPGDVVAALDAFRAQLPPDAGWQLADDGTFVVATATVAAAAARAVASADGDLARRTLADGRVRVELRLFRDGRPDGDVAVVAPHGEWPRGRALAVDFHDTAPTAADLRACAQRTVAARAHGQRVQFLNVPPALLAAAAGQGTPHDMPMREAVGPRLPAELVDLWSEP
jgi:DNA-binding response OmpR family regulator